MEQEKGNEHKFTGKKIGIWSNNPVKRNWNTAKETLSEHNGMLGVSRKPLYYSKKKKKFRGFEDVIIWRKTDKNLIKKKKHI